MKYSVIIPAAGKGERLNLGYNKLLYKKNDICILEMTLKNFILDAECSEIVIVCSLLDKENFVNFSKDERIVFVEGGATREESVFNGLQKVKNDYVLIHDGARPFITSKLINDVKEALMSHPSVVPVVKSKDATLINGRYEKVEVMLIQTPQGFHKDILLRSFEKIKEDKKFSLYKDDASIVQNELNIVPFCVIGDYKNIKITTSSDLRYLEVDVDASKI